MTLDRTTDSDINTTSTLRGQDAATAADSPAEFDPVSCLVEHLKSQFRDNLSDDAVKAFKSFEDKDLMTLSWKPKDQTKVSSLKFSLKVGAYHLGGRQLKVSLGMNDPDEPILRPVTGFYWYTATNNNHISFQFNFANKTTVAKMLKPEQILNEGEQNGQTILTYTSNARLDFLITRLPDYEEFAQTFFAEKAPQAKKHYGFNGGQSTFSKEIECFDLQYESGKTWSFAPFEMKARLEGTRVISTVFTVGDKTFDSFGAFVAHLCLAHLMVRIPLLLYGQETELIQGTNLEEFLKPKDFELSRPVSLNPHAVNEELRANGYEFPWHVLDAACTSLNAGKHVIFTGPPGCGKSALAIELARIMAGKKRRAPLVATASPAWSSSDLIGRYLPRREGKGLYFEPGLFLNAIKNQQWLIIDELNRANIDSAFGELFSVLAGDAPQLPFRAAKSDDESSDEDDEELSEIEKDDDRPKPVRIVPFGYQTAEAYNDRYVDYHVPQRFRLLATMNDADRSRLHQLSFAFQRRFNIIRVEAPNAQTINDLIKREVESCANTHNISKELSNHTYFITQEGRQNRYVYLDNHIVESTLKAIFARNEDDPAYNKFHDLIRERVTGVATIFDIIRFTAEGLRAPVNNDTTNTDSEQIRALRVRDVDDAPSTIVNQLIQSYIALALTMSVVPQLESLSGNPSKLFGAIRTCLQAFDEEAPLWRIENTGAGYELINNKLIRDFIASEIALQLGRETIIYYEELWKQIFEEKLIQEIPR